MIFRNLSFSYGDKKVLENFSAELYGGGITVISGPSGCGKTTLLRIAAGLEKPDAGSFEGPSADEIAFMFQENRLLSGLNAAEQITVAAGKNTDPLPWLKAVGLEGEEKSLTNQLSGGMQRRVSLARCLAYGRDKKLIILDEPFAGVDTQTALNILDFIRELNIPVLFSTHSEELQQKADKIIRLA